MQVARSYVFSRYLVTFLVLVSLLVGGCVGIQPGSGFNLVSVQQEWRLGNRLAQDIDRKANLVTNPDSIAYINQLGQRLVQQTEFRNLPWEFHIIRDREINAFNIPGGHVYVYTGLIQKASTESELAGVLAHEIAHGVQRHATQALTNQYGLSIITSLLLGQNPPIYEKLLAQILGAGYMASYSRSAERQADQLGARYMYQAGFDPNGMVIFFQKLLEEEREQPSLIEKFFSTHPLTEERIRNVSYEISLFPPRPDLITDEPQFHDFKNTLVGRDMYERDWRRVRIPRRYRY